jgi:FkbM family methyltransferase
MKTRIGSAKHLRKAVKGAFEIFGFRIIQKNAFDALTQPSDPFAEQRRLTKREDITIFDVGAHIGDVSKLYSQLFPRSTIYSFEPFLQTFAKLQTSVQPYPNIHIVNCGLAGCSGLFPLYDNNSSATNSLFAPDPAADNTWGEGLVSSKGVVQCQFTTLDEFVAEKRIDFIDILKIDVQGAETQVLAGAKKSLASHKIGLIYAEIITMPTYKGQKPFWEILKWFEESGMSLYNIYNCSLTEGRLRQIDAIFFASRDTYSGDLSKVGMPGQSA